MINELIAKTINGAIEKNGFSIDFLSLELSELMGYERNSVGGANEFIRKMRLNGGFHHKRNNPERDNRNLSILLYALGVPLDSEVITMLRQDRGLHYPPDNCIPYETILEKHKLKNHSSLKHTY